MDPSLGFATLLANLPYAVAASTAVGLGANAAYNRIWPEKKFENLNPEEKIQWMLEHRMKPSEYDYRKLAMYRRAQSDCPCISPCTENGEDSWCYVDPQCKTGRESSLNWIPGIGFGPGFGNKKWKYCNPEQKTGGFAAVPFARQPSKYVRRVPFIPYQIHPLPLSVRREPHVLYPPRFSSDFPR
jgi:hypothetical protein